MDESFIPAAEMKIFPWLLQILCYTKIRQVLEIVLNFFCGGWRIPNIGVWYCFTARWTGCLRSTPPAEGLKLLLKFADVLLRTLLLKNYGSGEWILCNKKAEWNGAIQGWFSLWSQQSAIVPTVTVLMKRMAENFTVSRALQCWPALMVTRQISLALVAWVMACTSALTILFLTTERRCCRGR